jgi:hypothetical protein
MHVFMVSLLVLNILVAAVWLVALVLAESSSANTGDKVGCYMLTIIAFPFLVFYPIACLITWGQW